MKTTKKHFAMFKKEVKNLIKLYGLVSYEVYIDHEDTDKMVLASTTVDFENRQVIITLNKNWADPISDYGLKAAAFHEILEVLFWRIESLSAKHYKDEAREEVHAIIQTLINVNKR